MNSFLPHNCYYCKCEKHYIKHYGTFGSPKIAKQVHIGTSGTWERHREHIGNVIDCMGTCGNVLDNTGTCVWT